MEPQLANGFLIVLLAHSPDGWCSGRLGADGKALPSCHCLSLRGQEQLSSPVPVAALLLN